MYVNDAEALIPGHWSRLLPRSPGPMERLSVAQSHSGQVLPWATGTRVALLVLLIVAHI